MNAPAQTPPRRPASRRRAAEAPPAGHRPLRSVGYRVPVVLDEELDAELDAGFGDTGFDDTGFDPALDSTVTASDRPGVPMWEQWESPPATPSIAPPLPVVAAEPVSVPVPVPAAVSAPVPARGPGDELDDGYEPEPPRSLYLAALRVHHLRPGILERVLLVEGVFAAAIILALADLASPWLIAVLPVVVAALVKLHDLVEEGIERTRPHDPRTVSSPGGSPGLR